MNIRYVLRRPSGTRPRGPLHNIGPAGIVILWAGLRIVFWNGYYVEDSPGYVTDAIYAALGEFYARDYVNGMNVGTFLPVAIPLRLFGKSEVALSLWPAACSLLGVASLAGLAAMLLGRTSGLFAGFLYATYPGDVFFSTVVMPDAIQAGWFSFSMFLIGLAYHGGEDRRVMTLACAGCALGVGYLARTNAAFLVPVGVSAIGSCLLLWRRESLWRLLRDGAAYLAGVAAVMGMEGMAYLLSTGDFFHRFHVVGSHYGNAGSIDQWGLNTDRYMIVFSLFAPLVWLMRGTWGHFAPDQAYHGLTFALAVLSLLAGWVIATKARGRLPRPQAAALCLATVWFVWPLLYQQFGSQSLTSFVPIHRLSRHFVAYAPGAICVTVVGLGILIEHSKTLRHGWRAIAIVVLPLTGAINLYSGWIATNTAFAVFQQQKAIHIRIREHLPKEIDHIIGDSGDLGILEFWLNPLGSRRVALTPFAAYRRCEEISHGVVLTFSNPGWANLGSPVVREAARRLPCLLVPPPTWRLLYGGVPEKIYVIDSPGRQGL